MAADKAQDCNDAPERPFAPPSGSVIDAMEDMLRACASGMNWMEQVSRARLSSATRKILTIDMGMCSSAIFKMTKILDQLYTANGGPGNASRQSPGQGSPIQDLSRPSQPSVIDTNSDAWAVFCGHWFVSEGFAPHPKDSRVLRAWVWFKSGESWGEHKVRETAPPNAKVSDGR